MSMSKIPNKGKEMLEKFATERLVEKTSKHVSSLNELRFILATTTDKAASLLPPTVDAYEQHALRALYQVNVWCQESYFRAGFDKNKWPWLASVRFNGLLPTLYKNESAPVEVRDITHLYCTDNSCQGQKCQCVQAGLPCIDICTHEMDCDNPNKKTEV